VKTLPSLSTVRLTLRPSLLRNPTRRMIGLVSGVNPNIIATKFAGRLHFGKQRQNLPPNCPILWTSLYGVKYYSQQICRPGGHVHALAALSLEEGHPVGLIFSG
jgi:hypothetical protein